MALIGAGERPFLMAEQLALGQRFGEGRTVHLDESVPATRARIVNQSAKQFLAGAGFTLDQHGQLARRDAPGPVVRWR